MSNFHSKSNKFVNHIVLKVQDINRSEDFYKSIMGFKILEKGHGRIVLTVDGSTPLITIIEPDDVVPKLSRRTGLYHLAILLPNRLDLGLFLKQIKSNNYPIIGGSNHGVSEAVYLQDPDDNGIEIYVDTNISTWKWKDKDIEMTNKRLDIDGLLDSATHKNWNGMPSETIIGHIHLHVADLVDSEKFYSEGLGFDLVSSIPNQAIFLSSGGYHHHIAVNIWNGKGSPALAPNSVGMKYFSIIFPNMEERQKIIDNLARLGYSVIKEVNDIFTEDPSSNRIKLSV